MADQKSDRQLDHWRGDFGNSYIDRNCDASHLRSRLIFWSHILPALSAQQPKSILEVGANIGNNIAALKQLTQAELFALEPNDKARLHLVENGILPPDRVVSGTAQSIPLSDASIDMVFTSGVLIHIAPENLIDACREIHRVARRYIVCAEYFSPQPEAKVYRGHDGLLFKNDFGSVYLDNFSDIELVGHGFFWRRTTGLDDLTWWAFAKRRTY